MTKEEREAIKRELEKLTKEEREQADKRYRKRWLIDPHDERALTGGKKISFATGQIDNWAIFVWYPNRHEWVGVKDIREMIMLKAKAQKYGSERLYNAFCRVYELSTDCVRDEALVEIAGFLDEFDEATVDLLTVLYYGMIAENNKKNAILKKRIKRYGVHMLLKEGKSAGYCANSMRNVLWYDIDRECKKRGF